MACNRDLEKLVEVFARKSISKQTENNNIWEFLKRRGILPMYGMNETKVNKVSEQAMWIPDEGLPDDVGERWYRVR
eukprot:4252312-Pyramimonas_sp.AAC.1